MKPGFWKKPGFFRFFLSGCDNKIGCTLRFRGIAELARVPACPVLSMELQMSHRLACWSGIVCLALGVPSAAMGQNRKPCCKPCGGSSTSSSVPNVSIPGMSIPSGPRFSIPSPPSFQFPTGPGGFNMPPALRRGLHPNAPLANMPALNGPLATQNNLQMQVAIQQNLQLQQGLMQQAHQQWMLQDMVKQQLLRFAIDAPTENLQRELKNSNAFVRWAASVELNRRWKLEKSVVDAEVRLAKALAARPVETPPAEAPAAAPRRVRAETPALVRSTSNDQSLLLQYGIPNSQ